MPPQKLQDSWVHFRRYEPPPDEEQRKSNDPPKEPITHPELEEPEDGLHGVSDAEFPS